MDLLVKIFRLVFFEAFANVRCSDLEHLTRFLEFASLINKFNLESFKFPRI
jgi:hypothetical protein